MNGSPPITSHKVLACGQGLYASCGALDPTRLVMTIVVDLTYFIFRILRRPH